jgi:RNA polymerase sigma-70 factor (ECF subfamily)
MENVESLVQAALCPDNTRRQRHCAFGQLVELFQGELYRRAYQMLGDAGLAQDATQETFIAAYQHLGQLRQAYAFPAWLQQILRTQCNRIFRKKAPPTCPLDEHQEVAGRELDPSTDLEHCDVRAAVLAAIDTLSDHERVVVQLFYLQEYSINEIAERLSLPLTTVKKRLQYAREHLRERIAPIQKVLAQYLAAADISYLSLEVSPFPSTPALIPSPVWIHNRYPLMMR